MNADNIIERLGRDNPLFHEINEADVRQSAAAGYTLTPGEVSFAVPAVVLRWIGARLTPDMVTLETGAGHTTVLFASLARHHYCCTYSAKEADKIGRYLDGLGIGRDKITFVIGSTAQTLPELRVSTPLDFAYIDGCHGYPFPALDWHYIDQQLKVGGMIGMDNVELRPVREHCDFLEENESYRLVARVFAGYFVRFYEKLCDQNREWIHQKYSLAKRDPCDRRLPTRIRRKMSKLIKPYLF